MAGPLYVSEGDEVKAEKYVGDLSRSWAKCVECGREFDLSDEEEASEFVHGHDCEASDD